MADNSSELVVETFKLTKIYQNRQIALNDVTLRLEPGCVLGPARLQRRRQDDAAAPASSACIGRPPAGSRSSAKP